MSDPEFGFQGHPRSNIIHKIMLTCSILIRLSLARTTGLKHQNIYSLIFVLSRLLNAKPNNSISLIYDFILLYNSNTWLCEIRGIEWVTLNLTSKGRWRPNLIVIFDSRITFYYNNLVAEFRYYRLLKNSPISSFGPNFRPELTVQGSDIYQYYVIPWVRGKDPTEKKLIDEPTWSRVGPICCYSTLVNHIWAILHALGQRHPSNLCCSGWL